MSPLSHPIIRISVLIAVVAVCTGCASDDGPEPDRIDGQPTMTTETTEEGYVLERLDTRGDGAADILRYYEEYQDPRQDDRTRRRIRKMEIDVTGDEIINVRRHYDEHGNVEREENDQNLDGTMDTTLEFTGGELSRKKLLGEEGEEIVEYRIYYDGELVRIEEDTNEDGQIDRWEYYEDEVLMRIGRDTNRDGSADTWQMR